MIIRAYSEFNAQDVNAPDPYIFISITDWPGHIVPLYPCHGVLRLAFDDVDMELAAYDALPAAKIYSLPLIGGIGFTGHLLTDAMAKQIWLFTEQNVQDVDSIFVHCRMGVSRSQAVAAALRSYYLPDQPNLNSGFNRIVYSIMMRNHPERK